MKSNWEITKQRSQYHFDTMQMDPRWDCVQHVGYIQPVWLNELEPILKQAQPVTWRTRGRNNDSLTRGAEEYDQEEYDLERIGMPRDHVVTDLTYNISPMFQAIADRFALDQCMARIHVQCPGQVWNLHLDKLEKWMPQDPTQVVRYFVQLTDWEMGHFWNFGNYCWTGWQAGDVATFDWLNVPHSTANAGHVPRATLQITGIKTAQTQEFLDSIR